MPPDNDSTALSAATNLSRLLVEQAERHADKPFMLFERQASTQPARRAEFRQILSYREFNQRVDQSCHYLTALGLRPGDIFNLHLPNCPGFLLLWFAAARLGAVMMPTNVMSTADELEYLLQHSGSRIAFTTREYQQSLLQCQRRIDCLEKIIICDPYSEKPAADSFESELESQADSAWQCPAVPADLLAIMYTSGTTSRPKGVMVTHANYLAAGRTVAEAIELGCGDRQFVVLPLFHGNAQYYSVMSALLGGASIALMDRFSASRYFDKCIEYDCSLASLFAAPMRMLLAQPEASRHLQNRLRLVLYAQNLTAQQSASWQQRFAAPLCQLWGMTETMGPPLMNPLRGERRNWTLGKAVGEYQVRLVDEQAEEVAPGEAGEITVRGVPGETIMSGYFRNLQASAATIRQGWLYSGDIAVQDDAGFFRFVDRNKDMIKRSGENVSAGEVENVLMQHPAVFECAVIGLPDEIRDEAIVAVVVLQCNARVGSAELIEFCRQRLASFRVPQRIEFKESLPKTAVGKIQKHRLRADLLSISLKDRN